MPLNEAQGYVHSNLTEKQQREAERALYGLEESAPTMTPDTLTYEDRVRMRRLLDQIDQKEAAGTKEFDLNKPPQQPYVYREFPFLLYHHGQGRTMPVPNNEERERMLAQGWSENPLPPEAPPEIPLTAAELAEVEAVDKKLEKKRK